MALDTMKGDRKHTRPKRGNGQVLIRDAKGNKLCISCKDWLPESTFNKTTSSSDGLSVYCILCSKIWKHEMTHEHFIALMAAQNNKCAICRSKFKHKEPHIDHDHNCCSGPYGCKNCIRGLLCFKCNNGLGSFEDDVYIVRNAVSYLERYGQL